MDTNKISEFVERYQNMHEEELVDIHEKFNKNGQATLIEFSRDDIAHYVGTATESLIRTLSDFKSEGLIEIKSGKISIVNLEKLKNLLY